MWNENITNSIYATTSCVWVISIKDNYNVIAKKLIRKNTSPTKVTVENINNVILQKCANIKSSASHQQRLLRNN